MSSTSIPELTPEPTPEPDLETPLASDLEPQSETGGAPKPDSGLELAVDPATHRFECRSCGFVYDPEVELDPIAFRCPVCRSRVGAFKDIGPRNKPSGFEENLNFGLGVNRLTPGQKNVLIFGGFALAFAFFLSLYSLR